ncbi:MAG: hypothetical protein R3249_11680 [Nitriliruptorales bacterium]|nr:hypothetical protein [Nitriliruptorales bacterium]
MAAGLPFRLMNATINRPLRALVQSPLHRLVSDRIAVISYTGRRSGKQYTLPAFYRDKGAYLTVAVGWPDEKVWWHNFTGEGGPVDVVVKGRHLTGHAVATRNGTDDAVVRITLDNPELRSA